MVDRDAIPNQKNQWWNLNKICTKSTIIAVNMTARVINEAQVSLQIMT